MSTSAVYVLLSRGTDRSYEDLVLEMATTSYLIEVFDKTDYLRADIFIIYFSCIKLLPTLYEHEFYRLHILRGYYHIQALHKNNVPLRYS